MLVILPWNLREFLLRLNAVPQSHAERREMFLPYLLQTVLLLFMQLETVFVFFNFRMHHTVILTL